MKKILVFCIVVLGTFGVALAQQTVTGRIVDAETGDGLPGATVVEKNTNNGDISDVDGKFRVNVSGSNQVILVISYVGFKTYEITVNPGENPDLGNLQLEYGSDQLSPIEIIASVAVDRKTPVAVAKVTALEIEERSSNQEF